MEYVCVSSFQSQIPITNSEVEAEGCAWMEEFLFTEKAGFL